MTFLVPASYPHVSLPSLPGVGGVVDKNKCAASCNGTSDHKSYLGYIGALVAVAFFGSNFVPVKKYDTGDGNISGCAAYCCFSIYSKCFLFD